MQRYIHKLRQKPDHIKKQIAFGITSVVMLSVAAIWISTFSLQFPGLVLTSNVPTSEAQTAAVLNQSPTSDDSDVTSIPPNVAPGPTPTTVGELQERLGSSFDDVAPLLENTSSDSNGVIISDPNQ